MAKQFSGLLFLVLLIVPISVNAETPMAVVETHISQLLEILRDPSLAGEKGKQVKAEKVVAISEDLFDFVELSKRSLGRSWNTFTQDERMEFVALYKKLLQRSYSDRITSYSDEHILFGKEITLSKNIVEVQTTLQTKTGDIAINYRLIEKDNRWKVYDVVIEGVSLIKNYQSQFREILANETPEALLEILRKKVGKD